MAILLDTFRDEEHVGRVHPILGTPLCIAAISSNVEMVLALVGRGVSAKQSVPDVDAFFNACSATFGVKNKPEYGTPIWIALAVYESLLDEKSLRKENLDVSERIISKLLHVDEDEEVNAKWRFLQDRRNQLEEEEKRKARLIIKDKTVVDIVSGVMDLSVMTEEKPSGWRDGIESTEEMSMRTFLRFFRGGG